MTQDFVLQTTNLQKDFGRVHAVEGVNLAIRRGSIFGFLGPNGSGKTTTIGMILSLIYPSAGTVTLFGESVTPAKNSALRRVGALVGVPAILPYASARENLQLAAHLHPQVTAQRIAEVLVLVGLEEAANRPAGRYSTGMKQRLGIGIAVLHQPELLILDEPVNGMDPSGIHEIRNLLRSLAEQGMTVFLSSHLLHEVEQLCDEVAVLDRGRIITQGRVQTLLGKGEALVHVRVPSPTEAATALLTLTGVTEVVPNGAYLTVRGISAESVISFLVARGIIPSEVTNGRPDLEQLFLQWTNHSSPQ
jgi:ABC-type multidrug transport system ATPase subunit